MIEEYEIIDEVMEQDVEQEEAKAPIPTIPDAPEEVKAETVGGDDFITRKLKVINNMNNPAKARSLAERVLNNRKAVK